MISIINCLFLILRVNVDEADEKIELSIVNEKSKLLDEVSQETNTGNDNELQVQQNQRQPREGSGTRTMRGTGTDPQEGPRTLTFFYKECCRLKRRNENECQCGRPIASHPDDVANGVGDISVDGEWTSQNDTKKVPSTEKRVFFPLNEVTGSQAKSARYIRISDDTDITDACWYHNSGMWEEDRHPEISISFIGGCLKDSISEELDNTLRVGITTVLDVLNCILITRGSHVELPKLIGSIFNEKSKRWNQCSTSSCIGVIPWECVKGNESLDLEEGEENAHYNPEIQGESSRFPLDPNHSDFFLIDDGSLKPLGIEIAFFSHLSHGFCKDFITSICILIGGGRTSLKMMHSVLFPATISIHPVPVIIMKGSGRLADLLSELLHCWEEMSTVSEKEEKIKTLLQSFGICNTALEEYVKLVFDCVNDRRDFLFEYEVGKESEDLKAKIIEAALKCVEMLQFNEEKKKTQTKIRLAMESSNSALVRDLVRNTNQQQLDYLLLKFFVEQKMKGLRDLIEKYEVNLQGFAEHWLHLLYQIDDSRDAGNRIFKFFKKTKPVSENQQHPFDIDDALKFLCHNETADGIHELLGDRIEYHKQAVNAVQSLLINRTLRLHLDTVKLLWFCDKYHPLSNALLVHAVLSGISNTIKKTEVFRYVPNKLKDTIEFFNKQMIDLLEIYYKTDREMTEEVLTTRLPLWKNQTFAEVVGNLELKDIIERPACELALMKSWSGEDNRHKEKLKRLKERADQSCCCSKPLYWLWYYMNYKMGVPNVKFWLHVIVYVLHLLAFSFFVLSWETKAHEVIKWVVLVFVFGLTLDEIRQIVSVQKGCLNNLAQWKSSVWNILDIISFILYYLGFGLDYYDPFISKAVFSFYLLLSWIKIAQFLRKSEDIGPYLVMIIEMLLRMKSFLIVVTISVISYGVLLTAMLFPASTLSWTTVFTIFFRPYLLLFADAGLETYELNNSTTVFGTPKVNSGYEIAVVIGMAIFLLFANTLLINILIADFSNIYDKTQKCSNQICQYEKFVLLKEFIKKPILPAPLSIFENCWILLKYMCNRGEDWKDVIEDVNVDIKKRNIAEFEHYCFKKLYPKVPDLT
ncbi:transient receptor potential cation channel subfamily M member 2-like isoform X2 [Rhopilema esculentum]|uniref:transient receptor potential cation channel subfamily M member 2-like isoform X2 n=1 Tax=Rhopilema esculentum TaxID=499914 RepID=UPI0031DB7132